MDKSFKYDSQTISWEKHPFLMNVWIKRFISASENFGITCCLTKVEKGHTIPLHIHEKSDDCLYIIEGSGVMYVEDLGEFDVKAGEFVRVAAGKKHGMLEVYDTLIFHDLFHPEEF